MDCSLRTQEAKISGAFASAKWIALCLWSISPSRKSSKEEDLSEIVRLCRKCGIYSAVFRPTVPTDRVPEPTARRCVHAADVSRVDFLFAASPLERSTAARLVKDPPMVERHEQVQKLPALVSASILNSPGAVTPRGRRPAKFTSLACCENSGCASHRPIRTKRAWELLF